MLWSCCLQSMIQLGCIESHSSTATAKSTLNWVRTCMVEHHHDGAGCSHFWCNSGQSQCHRTYSTSKKVWNLKVAIINSLPQQRIKCEFRPCCPCRKEKVSEKNGISWFKFSLTINSITNSNDSDISIQQQYCTIIVYIWVYCTLYWHYW